MKISTNIGKKTTSSILIGIIIILFIIFHIPDINPHLDYSALMHEWRQTDVLSVAKNFYTENMNILYPRIDQRGNLTGITGMEFPLFNYVLALLYLISGKIIPFYGKILSLSCAFGCILMMFKITKLDPYFKKNPINPVIFTACAMLNLYFFSFSILVMPEFFALLLSLIGFYQFQKYKENKSNITLIISCISLSTGMLVRPYTAFFGFSLLIEFINNIIKKNKKESVKLAILGAITLTPLVLWYGYWVPYLDNKYGIHYFFMGSPIKYNLIQIIKHIKLFLNYMFINFHIVFSSNILNFFLILGIILYIKNISKYKKTAKFKNEYSLIRMPIFQIFLIAILSIIFIPIIIGNSAQSIIAHQYYFCAIYPAFIISTAIGISYFYNKKNMEHNALKIIVVILLCVNTINICNFNIGMRKTKQQLPKWNEVKALVQNKKQLLKNVKTNDLVITSPGVESPVLLYLINRKGWVVSMPKKKEDKIKYLKSLEKKGAKFYLYAFNNNYGDKNIKPDIKFKITPVNIYIKQLKQNSLPKKELVQAKY